MIARQRAGAAGLAAGYLALQWLGRTYGTSREERRAAMPGDDLVGRPQIQVTHAITIPAPPARVWPWLAQVGWHRGGWYTARWVDVLLFPDNLPSADRVLDDFQQLEVGDLVPDGRPDTECFFVVRECEPGQRLVLQSTTHLPLSWRVRDRARINWTWSFVLTPEPGGGATRLVFRWRARTRPWWLTLGAHLLIVPADFVMSRDMLIGLRERAGERVDGPAATGRPALEGEASPARPSGYRRKGQR
ncbi:hypothetical protein FB382_001728 [Nocardioides ginsengisegetis]|uniref:Polyketide cyclase / dehydrase and lipid transport n=1 Tax=Nocardioides ginsengisegetis TaxID=661491 RepID=A0A7W3IZE5_9ACTN|nr:SRPBCC family protein [Nocardioides ginsengisegetis]MBA8803437.1 hypothetical protein [Nocardioides ginsengisegetis]